MFTLCRQENATYFPHFHTTWVPSFRASLYACAHGRRGRTDEERSKQSADACCIGCNMTPPTPTADDAKSGATFEHMQIVDRFPSFSISHNMDAFSYQSPSYTYIFTKRASKDGILRGLSPPSRGDSTRRIVTLATLLNLAPNLKQEGNGP